MFSSNYMYNNFIIMYYPEDYYYTCADIIRDIIFVVNLIVYTPVLECL